MQIRYTRPRNDRTLCTRHIRLRRVSGSIFYFLSWSSSHLGQWLSHILSEWLGTQVTWRNPNARQTPMVLYSMTPQWHWPISWRTMVCVPQYVKLLAKSLKKWKIEKQVGDECGPWWYPYVFLVVWWVINASQLAWANQHPAVGWGNPLNAWLASVNWMLCAHCPNTRYRYGACGMYNPILLRQHSPN